jgi:small subunit ribosomal protein S4e
LPSVSVFCVVACLSSFKMGRGPKKHLKRLNAPSHWMLDKMSGRYAPRPSQGPHKIRDCLPLVLILRNRLRYALSRREAKTILKQKLVRVDHKVRTDPNYPAGFMDLVCIDKTKENFRLLYDTRGRFMLHKVPSGSAEIKIKLCKITKVYTGHKGIPFAVTHDSRTIRYPHPDLSVGDSVVVNLHTGKPSSMIKQDVGNLCMITGGRNQGRIGVLENKEKHDGGFSIAHVKDAAGHPFSTRLSNVFMLHKGPHQKDSIVSLPKGGGVKLSILQQREKNLSHRQVKKVRLVGQ